MRPKALLAFSVGLASAACAHSSSTSAGGAPSPSESASAPSPDPRVGLKAGWWDAGEAIWNLKLVSNTKPSEKFLSPSTPGEARLTNSDLAFFGNYVMQGNYSGYQVWDISNPSHPTLKTSYVCPGSQSDVSVYGHLLFVSAEANNGRTDCGLGGVADSVSHDRARGIRIFDITDISNPKAVTMVQTCRGSHTHTVVDDPNDKSNVYIYVSGMAAVRSPNELTGCSGAMPEEDANSALFRIEVIKVPLAHPEQAAIVSSPRIFSNASNGDANGLGTVARHRESPEDSALAAARTAARNAAGGPRRPQMPRSINQCHDITVYPAIGLAGGACGGMGLILDIHDPAHPKRIGAVADSNMSFWHSATFNNDGTQVLFSDEWGGGSQPRCRATDKHEWGADALFQLKNDGQMTFTSYYKMSAPQTVNENCVAHNGSLIPIPGRDVMVQAWYQGGVSIFDWTDPSHPKEIAYFDRGPMDSTKLVDAGYWSTYWYNGYIVGSEISRGLDIFELKASPLMSQNEIDAAKLVHFDFLNVQDQPKFVWPAAFVVARAYVDQLVRNHGLPADRTIAVSASLKSAEGLHGDQRSAALNQLATQLDGDAQGAGDPAKVRRLAAEVREIASVAR